ncbi:hypothetical protein azo2697 [Azoarcus olearius]|uniref:Glycosyltransferase 2-like domain-containing protein n=2 Tax=Azoarcus sp. (strain BH72) TaxID=418699 RepID=A1K908_AZOSB|nr:hypothetical protein azo2697 [Azoarcus olearius]
MSRMYKLKASLLRRADRPTIDLSQLESISPPASEAELIGRWRADAPCVVSICMLTYNHAPYLRKALDGILGQQTDFGFEILIHDDASTDGTQDIIREYQLRYPTVIKPILQTENQWSQGVNPSITYNYPRANAEFVTWCEGDDMWTDPLKLALQVDGLRRHPSINLSFHQAVLVHYGQKCVKPYLIGDYADSDRIVSFHEAIYRPQGLIPTASCMVRWSVKQKLAEFMKTRGYIRGGDVFLQMFGAMGDGALYHAKPMSIYRFQTRHSLTRGMRDEIEKLANHQAAVIRAYLEINRETGGSLSRELKTLIFQRILWLFNREPVPPQIIRSLNLDALMREFLKIKRAIHRKAVELNESPRNHVIYGCGSGCTMIMKKIDQAKVSCIVDRDGKWIGEEIFEKPIVSADEIAKFPDCNLIVSTLAPDKRAIERLAARHGVKPERIHYFFDDLVEAIDMDLLSREAHDLPYDFSGQRPPGWWPRNETRTVSSTTC